MDGSPPPEPRSWSRTLRAGPTTAAEARWFLREATRDERGSIDLDAAELLTTELASNAALHGKEPIEVTVLLEDDELQVSVQDQGGGFDPEQVAGHGYGMSLLEALATQWGVEHGGEGTEVWFRI